MGYFWAAGDIAARRGYLWVAGVLAKSTRRHIGDLPADPERLLNTDTYEGFPVRPLYTVTTSPGR